MKPRALVLLFGLILILVLVPGAATAQGRGNDARGVLVRIDGTTHVARGDRAGTVVGLNGDVVVDGTVRDTLVVVNADAVVTGAVDGDVALVNGTLTLQPGARVGGDVTLVKGTLVRAPGATIAGSVQRRTGYSFGWGPAVFSFLFWLGLTVVVVLAGLLFAAVGGRQLTEPGRLLTDRPGASVATALVVWIGIPILAVLGLVTLIGLPLGLALLLVVLPALWLLGYLVAGTRLGAELVGRRGRPRSVEHPYLAAVVGLLLLQVFGLIPVVGGLVVGLAGLVGAGAMMYRPWRAWRAPRPHPAAPAPEPVPPV
jgi:cytoskeletal protein CcmA (bactofilin family)